MLLCLLSPPLLTHCVRGREGGRKSRGFLWKRGVCESAAAAEKPKAGKGEGGGVFLTGASVVQPGQIFRADLGQAGGQAGVFRVRACLLGPDLSRVRFTEERCP